MTSMILRRNLHLPPTSGCLNIVLFLLLVPAASSVNFETCLEEIRDGKWGEFGGTDNLGKSVDHISNATGITYELCVRACGSGSEPFLWSVFSQQFSSWLLPWLALISQLPFGANDKFENIVAMFLTVGSPTLAAYSLILTVLNGRWIARRFSTYSYPNTRTAVRILNSLQQSPLEVSHEAYLLTSLVVLPVNDEWWKELVIWMDYTHTWSISAVASIAWVLIAYIFTIIDSVTGDLTTLINSNGQGVGSLWIWLLPIVVCWLQISPKCDSVRLHQAVDRANQIAYVASCDAEPVLAASISKQRAISLSSGTRDSSRSDEACTAPIYNYVRFLFWLQAVEAVSDVVRAASIRAHMHHSVDPDVPWEKEDRLNSGPRAANRRGNRVQVENYCHPVGETSPMRGRVWGPEVWSRIFIASLLALFLQWATTGAAIVVSWFTPTAGLGCRSGGYVVYGAMSTLVWMLLVLSSFLSYHAATAPHATNIISPRVTRSLSIILRRLGKVIAVFNAVWSVMICVFQFANFFDRCYCNSSVLGLGHLAYNVIDLLPNEAMAGVRGAWIGGVALGVVSATLFILFVNLFVNPRLPD